MSEGYPHGQSRRGAHQYQLRGTSESHDADVHAALHPLDKRLFEEVGESRSGGCASLHVVQLRAHSSDATGHASDGGGHLRPRVELSGTRGAESNEGTSARRLMGLFEIWRFPLELEIVHI